MGKLIILDLYRPINLLDQPEPCYNCDHVSDCTTTCELAAAWWDQFAEKFNLNKEV